MSHVKMSKYVKCHTICEMSNRWTMDEIGKKTDMMRLNDNEVNFLRSQMKVSQTTQKHIV